MNLNKSSNELLENLLKEKNEKKGGFYDLPIVKKCNHPEHNPPSHLHIPQGKGYRHICPNCGFTADLVPPQISF